MDEKEIYTVGYYPEVTKTKKSFVNTFFNKPTCPRKTKNTMKRKSHRR